MDDATESPAAVVINTIDAPGDENADLGDEEEVLDWSKLALVKMTLLGNMF